MGKGKRICILTGLLALALTLVYSWQAEETAPAAMEYALRLFDSSYVHNVDLELEATPDLLTAELVSGDLELTLPEDRSFRLRCKTVSGDFESELPLTKLGKKEWQYNAAGNPADFQIETVSGDVTVNCG